MKNLLGIMLKYAGPSRERMSYQQGIPGRLAVQELRYLSVYFHCGRHSPESQFHAHLPPVLPLTGNCCQGQHRGVCMTAAFFTLETNSLAYVELIIQIQQLKGLADQM